MRINAVAVGLSSEVDIPETNEIVMWLVHHLLANGGFAL